jgi:hypothetical protein
LVHQVLQAQRAQQVQPVLLVIGIQPFHPAQ